MYNFETTWKKLAPCRCSRFKLVSHAQFQPGQLQRAQEDKFYKTYLSCIYIYIYICHHFYLFQVTSNLGEFTAIMLENNVRENIG